MSDEDDRLARIGEIQKKNFLHFVERGPGLSYGYTQYVIARDRANALVLLGGLGGVGAGTMWFAEEPHHSRLEGYEDAPEETHAEATKEDLARLCSFPVVGKEK